MEDSIKIILENLLLVVVTVMSPFIMWFVHRGLAYLEKRYGLKVEETTRENTYRLIYQGVCYADEQAKKALKVKKPTKSQKKLDMAMEFIVAEMKRNKLPEIAEDQLKKIVEAGLFSDRRNYSLEVLGE